MLPPKEGLGNISLLHRGYNSEKINDLHRWLGHQTSGWRWPSDNSKRNNAKSQARVHAARATVTRVTPLSVLSLLTLTCGITTVKPKKKKKALVTSVSILFAIELVCDVDPPASCRLTALTLGFIRFGA